MTEFSCLRYSVTDHIAEIVLDSPPMNLIDPEMTAEYLTVLDMAENDPEVRVIVLSGAGKGLSAGVNLRLLEGYGATDMKDFLSVFYVDMMRKVRVLTKPIMASVHGFAMEGACTLAFACDMIIAAEDTKFGYPGVPNLAAPPGMHVWFLQKLIGRMKAAELIYTGEPITAVEAERMGLITRAVPKEDLYDETMKLAKKIAGMSPLALKTAREMIYRMEDMDFSSVPNTALDMMAFSFTSEDSLEARKAYNEKRPPVWKGK